MNAIRTSEIRVPAEPFTWVDSAAFLAPMGIVAVLILLARWSGVMA
jgi:hypothetical protein